MAKFGTSSAGVTPYGPGTPITAQEPPLTQSGAKFLDFMTGDYKRDATGAYERMPETRQRVMLAVGTIQGTAQASPEHGTKFPDRITEAYPDQAKNEVKRALNFLTSTDEIRLDGIDVEQTQTIRVEHTINYTPSDGKDDQVKF